jgi:hypothetical protein
MFKSTSEKKLFKFILTKEYIHIKKHFIENSIFLLHLFLDNIFKMEANFFLMVLLGN